MSWLNYRFLASDPKTPRSARYHGIFGPKRPRLLSRHSQIEGPQVWSVRGPSCGCGEPDCSHLPPLLPCSSQFISPSLCSADLSRMWGRLLHQVLRGFPLEGRSQKASNYSYFGNECISAIFRISRLKHHTTHLSHRPWHRAVWPALATWPMKSLLLMTKSRARSCPPWGRIPNTLPEVVPPPMLWQALVMRPNFSFKRWCVPKSARWVPGIGNEFADYCWDHWMLYPNTIPKSIIGFSFLDKVQVMH